ncbi:hypothetical protein TNCT_548671 [Trichonephila clavata]|uniref:Uncharacterized protein n=1 Tax=Trichonephila clavata TaxID=2740835 RepID=A0A8X6FXI8_TRICU|nr:hypothetical protein TNCT_548671 [Trichonephila clavata]
MQALTQTVLGWLNYGQDRWSTERGGAGTYKWRLISSWMSYTIGELSGETSPWCGSSRMYFDWICYNVVTPKSHAGRVII